MLIDLFKGYNEKDVLIPDPDGGEGEFKVRKFLQSNKDNHQFLKSFFHNTEDMIDNQLFQQFLSISNTKEVSELHFVTEHFNQSIIEQTNKSGYLVVQKGEHPFLQDDSQDHKEVFRRPGVAQSLFDDVEVIMSYQNHKFIPMKIHSSEDDHFGRKLKYRYHYFPALNPNLYEDLRIISIQRFAPNLWS